MTRPAILDAIDEALVTHEPKGVRASANEAVLFECIKLLTPQGPFGGGVPYTVNGETVSISRSLAQIGNGWIVRRVAGFERPAGNPGAGQLVGGEG